MKKRIEFAVALIVSTICWLCLFPLLGASSLHFSTWLLVAVIPAYALLLTVLFQLFYGAEILLGARFNANLVFAALMAAVLGIPYGISALLGLVFNGFIVSYAWLALAVFAGDLLLFGAMMLAGPSRDRADKLEILRAVTLLNYVDGVYLPVIRNMELVRGERFTIVPAELGRVEEGLKAAWSAMTRRDWNSVDLYLLETIPQLEHCGALGVLRMQVACRVMQHSFAEAGNKEKAAEYAIRLRHLEKVYEESGAF